MLIINPPLAVYKHLAAFSFMLAGIFADLLVVRLCLTSAYVFLIVNGILGSPFWPSLRRPDHITVDMLIWGFVCFYVHMSSVIRLLLDEQHVKLTEDQEAMWRMLYRVGGLSRKIFQYQIAPHMQVVHFKKGDVIPSAKYFHIAYKGTVEIQVNEDGKLLKTAIDGSGCMFDLKSLGLLQAHTPMASHVLKVTALSDCTCFQFLNRDIRDIANAKNTKLVWQTILLGMLARLAVQRLPEGDYQNRTDPDHVDPLFVPLSVSEEPNPLLAGSGSALEKPLSHIWYCMQRFFTPPWPFSKHLVGVRHNMLPAPVPTEGSTNTLEIGINRSDDEFQSLVQNKHGGGPSSYTLT